MKFYLEGYYGPQTIASVSRSEATTRALLSDEHWVLSLERQSLLRQGEESVPLSFARAGTRLEDLMDYDVVLIETGGVARVLFAANSNSNTLFVTGRCNSNCIMCPNGDAVNKSSVIHTPGYLTQIINYIPSDAGHLTITGGEPFLLKYGFFELMDCFNKHLPGTKLLLLTNGRALANRAFAGEFTDRATKLWRTAIPLHAADAALHDAVSRSDGSFRQTMAGLRNIADSLSEVEIRVVVSLFNYKSMEEIARMILRDIPRVTQVNFVGLEMMGNAVQNADSVWIDYRTAFLFIRPAIHLLIERGVDLSLYNFPLCAVDAPYWSLCARSISDYKVRFEEACLHCAVKGVCGGIFSSTSKSGRFCVRPVSEVSDAC